ncbi:MAG: hypothetical protein ACOYMN_17805 [Roseimicrobium sp.]
MNTLRQLPRALVLSFACLTASCVSLEQAAPHAETLPQRAHVGTLSQISHGRVLYVTKCAKCHSVEPVKKYSTVRWEEQILPEMAEETKLTHEECAAVRAYVLTVLRS